MNDFTEQELLEIVALCRNAAKFMDVLEGMAPVNGDPYRINLATISLKAKKAVDVRKRVEVPKVDEE